MTSPLKEKIDYYFNEEGLLVLTETFLRKRNFCCGSGCLHCPYGFVNVPRHMKAAAFQKKREDEKKNRSNSK